MRPGSAGPWTGSSRTSRSSPRAPPSGRRPDDEGPHGERAEGARRRLDAGARDERRGKAVPQGSAGGERGSTVRGASRASLAEAKEQLAAVTARGADPGQLVHELVAVA